MKKRIISIALVLCMVMSLIPATAFAGSEGTRYIYYQGTWITSQNLSGDGYSYDPENSVLTLQTNILQIRTTDVESSVLYASDFSTKVVPILYVWQTVSDLTIRFEGTSSAKPYTPTETGYTGKYNGEESKIAYAGIIAPDTNLTITGNPATVSTHRVAIQAKNLTVNSKMTVYSYCDNAVEVTGTLTANADLTVHSRDGGAYLGVHENNMYDIHNGTTAAISVGTLAISKNVTVSSELSCESVTSNGIGKHYVRGYAVLADSVKVNGGTLKVKNTLNVNGFQRTVKIDGTSYVGENIMYGLQCDELTLLDNGTVDTAYERSDDFKDNNNIRLIPAKTGELYFTGAGRINYYHADMNWKSFDPWTSLEICGPYECITDYHLVEYQTSVSTVYTQETEGKDLYITVEFSRMKPVLSRLREFGYGVQDGENYLHYFEYDEFMDLLRTYSDCTFHILAGDFTMALNASDLHTMPQIVVESGTLTIEDESQGFKNPSTKQSHPADITMNPITIGEEGTVQVETVYAILKNMNVTGSGKLLLQTGTTQGMVADSIQLSVNGGSHNLTYNGTASADHAIRVQKTVYDCMSEHGFDWKESETWVTSVYKGKTDNFYEYGHNEYVYPDEDNHLYLWTPEGYTNIQLKVRDDTLDKYDPSYVMRSLNDGALDNDGTGYIADSEFLLDDKDFGDVNYVIGSAKTIISEGLYEDYNSFGSATVSYIWYLTDKNNQKQKLSGGRAYTMQISQMESGDYTLSREVLYRNKAVIRTDYWHIHAISITQPKNAHAVAGKDVAFTVDFRYDSDDYTYSSLKWQVNKGEGYTDISGASNKTYTVTGITDDTIGQMCGWKYRAAIIYKNASDKELIFYTDEVSLYQLSMDKTTNIRDIREGAELVLTAFDALEMQEGYTVSWSYTDSRDGSVHTLDGTGLAYKKTAQAADDYFDYKCVVSYDGVPVGQHTFSVAVVAFDEPKDQVADVGEEVTFTSDILKQRHTWSPKYQWQADKNDGNGFQNISGATQKTYTFMVADADVYEWKF